MSLLSRVPLAFQAAWKSLFPFNQVPLVDGGGAPEKLSEPYRKSVWVQRAIKKVSGPIGAVSLQFSSQGRRGDALYENAELEAFWQKPARNLSSYEFVEASVGWLKLKGETFWIMDDTWLVPFGGQRSPLVVARPDRMQEIVRGGELLGWTYRDGNGVSHTLLPQNVVHLKCWNPYHEHRGLAEYEAAEMAAEADYLAGKFKRNLMANNGDQGAYVIAQSGMPTDDQRKMIVEQLRAKREMQQRGIYRPVFLTGDIKIEDAKIAAPDANFVASRLADRHEIFLAFGVPPSMADKMESYSVGSASDYFMLLNETCMPTAALICEGIEAVSQRLTNLKLYAWHNWDEHPVMQTARRERMDAIEKLWTKGMPMREINDYLDLGLPEFSGWDVGYLPFSVAPADALASSEPLTDPAESETYSEENEEVVQEMIRALQCGHARAGQANEERGHEEGAAFQKARSEKEVARWREHMAKRRITAKAYESRFNRELMKARGEVLRKLESFESSGKARLFEGLHQRAAAGDFLFDLETFKGGLLAGMRKVSAIALQKSGQELLKELAKDDPFTMAPEAVLQFVKGRENKLSGVADEIFDQVKEALTEGLNSGETMAQLAGRVRNEFNEASKERALRIAMTETAAAYGTGRETAMKQAGVKAKQWLTSGNDNVRPAHADANGQTVSMDEPFLVGGEELMHPGDPKGSPGNVINCHCVSIPVEAAT